MNTKRVSLTDGLVIVVLTLLWALFWWRILTPNPANQLTIPGGDFSAQFLAFGEYQAQRLLSGEIPLWNPYNLAGHPFLADTQAAVFYPPRLITIFVSGWFFDGWGYAALQAEAVAHFWIASVLMYAALRVMVGPRAAAFAGAVTFAYGGFMTGYPPQQLAVLEAAVWLPLALMGVRLGADQDGPRWGWFTVAGLALGLSLLAGHPQTSLYFSYMVVAYALFRGWYAEWGIWRVVWATTVVVVLGYGLAMVQLLPGLEYTRLTTRTSIGFDALRGGFPFHDMVTLVFPGVLTTWSPLFVGVPGLVLAAVGLRRRMPETRFWGVTLLTALVLSFGGATLLFHLAYLVIPGFAWFRGQERAAYLVTVAASVLIAHGLAAFLAGEEHGTRRMSAVLAAVCGVAGVQLMVANAIVEEDLTLFASAAFFSFLTVGLLWGLAQMRERVPVGLGGVLAVGLVTFSVASVTINTSLEPVPVANRNALDSLARTVATQPGLYRVDGVERYGNYGTLGGFEDIRGVSPLKLQAITDLYTLPPRTLWELLNVRYVMTDFEQVEVPTTVIAVDESRGFPIRLHEVTDPAPRAWMVYEATVTAEREEVLALLADPAFPPLERAILAEDPPLRLPESVPADWDVTITAHEPETIRVEVDTPANGILMLSEMAYPGWRAEIDGERVPILTANAGLRAVAVPAGEHEVTLAYAPVSFTLGAALSGVTALAMVGIVVWGKRNKGA